MLLLILSFIKTAISYLFGGNTVFTLVTIGSIQVHLDDVILIWLLLFCIFELLTKNQIRSIYFGMQFFIIVPIVIALLHGVISGTTMSGFLSDTRKFILFIVAMMACYLVFHLDETYYRMRTIKLYINRLMNCVLVYTFIIWCMDLLLGFNSLPGQQNGLLSDGGSTFRIINPPLVFMIALYTLYLIYNDLDRKRYLGLRSLIFTVVVILMQWRTVVAAFLVGLVVLMISYFANNRGITKNLFLEIILIVLICAGLAAFGGGSSIGEMIQNLFSSYGNISTDEGTFATRTDAWALLIGSLSGISIIIGRPFGYTDTSLDWQYSAHSGYVDFIVATGYFGLACLIVFMIFLIVNCIRKRNVLLITISIAFVVYWIGYGFTIEQGAMLGVILGILENYDLWKSEDCDLGEMENELVAH